MRASSSALIGALGSGIPLFTADLYAISLRDGSLLTYCDMDYPITYGGHIYANTGPAITRKSWNVKNTLEVPQLEVELLASATGFNGSNLKIFLHNGLFAGAHIILTRAYMPTPGDVSLGGFPILFGGSTSTITLTARGAKIIFRGDNNKMLSYMPRNRYMRGCIHALYDLNCKINRAANTFATTIASANALSISWASDPTGGHYANLQQGTITFTSGTAIGTTRTIQFTSSTGLQVSSPLYNIPNVGDNITVTYGCDRTKDGGQGCAFFANQQNYRGFPFIPPAEVAL